MHLNHKRLAMLFERLGIKARIGYVGTGGLELVLSSEAVDALIVSLEEAAGNLLELDDVPDEAD